MPPVNSVSSTQATSSVAPGAAEKPKNSATKFIEAALKFKGLPYLWGGGHGAPFTKPGRVDCSGLVAQAAHLAGINKNFDGVASAQQRMGQRISPVTPANLKPGDFVTMGNPAHHIGIYIGNNQVIHAPHTGDVVKISPLTGYGWDGANRVFDEAGEPIDGSNVPDAPGASSGGPSGASSAGSSSGSSGGSSGGTSGGSSGGDSSAVRSGGGARSAMSLPRSGGAAPRASAAPAAPSPPTGTGRVTTNFDWEKWMAHLEEAGLTPWQAAEVAEKARRGDRKGALAVFMAKGMPAAAEKAVTDVVGQAPAMGAPHEMRDEWFISQYGSKSNPNEDLPGAENGNCGPTSLTMVAKAFGKISPNAGEADAAIEESRRRMGEGSDETSGTSVAGIAKGAESYGLDAKIRSDANLDTIQEELAKGRLVIAHVSTYHLNGNKGGGHFTVVTGIKDGKVYLNDPARKDGPMVVDAGVFMDSINDRGTHAMVSIGA